MEDFTVFVATWNVATRFPGEDLKTFLGLNSTDSAYIGVPDLYVIGFQEVKSQPQNMVWDTLFEDPWTAKVKAHLAPLGLVKIHTLRMQGLVTSIFIKRAHLIYLRDVETLTTRRGFAGIWGNKGAISVRLGIHGCSLCFVNCHLTAHDEMLQERIDDYKSILDGQVFSYRETSNILFHDYVFWFGDLNFRLSGMRKPDEIVEMVSKNKVAELLVDDQLTQVRRSGEAFSELQESDVTFPPTYKFETGVDSYDTKRRPGWPDRILYHVNSNVYEDVKLKVQPLSYKSHMCYRTSDHRPVTASFKIQVFRPTIEKLVEFHDIPFWYLNETNKVFFSVCPTLETSPEDWIAIFKDDFSSLDEYVAYVYSPASQSTEPDVDTIQMQELYNPEEASVVFMENTIPFEGSYVLLYFSHASRSIYGMSQPFNAIKRPPSVAVDQIEDISSNTTEVRDALLSLVFILIGLVFCHYQEQTYLT